MRTPQRDRRTKWGEGYQAVSGLTTDDKGKPKRGRGRPAAGAGPLPSRGRWAARRTESAPSKQRGGESGCAVGGRAPTHPHCLPPPMARGQAHADLRPRHPRPFPPTPRSSCCSGGCSPPRVPRAAVSLHVLGAIDGGKSLAGGQRAGGRPHQQVCQVRSHDAPVPGGGLGDDGGARGRAVLQWAWPDDGVGKA